MIHFESLLHDESVSPGRYILRAWLIQFVPVVAVAALVHVAVGSDSAHGNGSPSAFRAVELLFLAPLLENAMLALVLWALQRMRSIRVRALTAAIPFGLIHLGAGPVGIVAVWSFYVFSVAYLVRKRKSWLEGFGISVAIHSLANLVPTIATYL